MRSLPLVMLVLLFPVRGAAQPTEAAGAVERRDAAAPIAGTAVRARLHEGNCTLPLVLSGARAQER